MYLLFALACTPAPLVPDTEPALEVASISCEGVDQTARYAGSTLEVDAYLVVFHLLIEGCAVDQALDLAASEVGPVAGCGLDQPAHPVGWDVSTLEDEVDVTIAGSALGCESSAAPGEMRPTLKLVGQ